VSGLVDEATFHAALACIEPTIDPDGPRGLEIKRRLEGCAGVLITLFRSNGSSNDETKSFGAYAAAGAHFLRGLTAIDQYRVYHLDLIERITGEKRGAFVPIDPYFVKKAEAIIELMKRIESNNRSVGINKDKTQNGPNSKPWLHETVMALWQLWDDEGQKMRKKKDFIDFCFAFLNPARLCITRYSIEESYDRHVKLYIAEHERMRKNYSSRQLEI
jgi:hypothetical protein